MCARHHMQVSTPCTNTLATLRGESTVSTTTRQGLGVACLIAMPHPDAAALAEAYGQVSQVDEGLYLVAEALAYVEKTGEHDAKAWLHRLHGELLLRQIVPDAPQAEACFQQALDTARRQQAKSWELRAAMSLSRRWQRQGKRAAAYELLAPVYGWFTEGFDTADLRETKALLEELA
jgi:predicted ATPase